VRIKIRPESTHIDIHKELSLLLYDAVQTCKQLPPCQERWLTSRQQRPVSTGPWHSDTRAFSLLGCCVAQQTEASKLPSRNSQYFLSTPATRKLLPLPNADQHQSHGFATTNSTTQLRCDFFSGNRETVTMEAVSSSEMAVTTYQSTRCHIAEYWNCQRRLGRPRRGWEDNIKIGSSRSGTGRCRLDRSGSEYGQVAGSCECGNEPSDSTKCGEFRDSLRTC
jgi:hypothetical protein